MAVDTRDKRASALNYQQPSFWLWPNPDGAIDTQADRQHVGHVYLGISAGALATADCLNFGSVSMSVPKLTGVSVDVPKLTGVYICHG